MDIESAARVLDPARLARRFLSDPEQKDLARRPARQQRRAFLACWTRKEAVAKAFGLGLAMPFDSFDAGPDTGGLLRIRPQAGINPLAVRVAPVALGRHWFAALAAVPPSRRRK